MKICYKYGSTDFETSSPLKACVDKDQEERLTFAIMKLSPCKFK